MVNYTFYKVPKEFCFPFSKKKIKEFIKPYEEYFSKIIFRGISHDESYMMKSFKKNIWWLGILDCYREDGKWLFNLKIEAVRKTSFENISDKVVNVLFDDMEKWIRKKIFLPLTAPEEPRQLFLSFSNDEGVVRSTCHEVNSRK